MYNTYLIGLLYFVLVCVRVHIPIVCPPLTLSNLFVLEMDLSQLLDLPSSTSLAGQQTPGLLLSLPSSVLALQAYMTILGILPG